MEVQRGLPGIAPSPGKRPNRTSGIEPKADVRQRGWSQWVDATPSVINLFFKGGVV
jgi:hypothetical protein